MKTPNIRFNLKFYDATGAEQVVRGLGDLRECFNLSDLYDYFEKGVLSRWLRSIGEDRIACGLDEAIRIQEINERVSGLCNAISLEVDNRLMSDFAALIRLQEKMKRQRLSDKEIPEVACGFGVGYRDMYLEVFDNVRRYNLSALKISVRRVMRHYEERFIYDLRRSFLPPERYDPNRRREINRDSIVLLLLWGNKKWREYFLRINLFRVLEHSHSHDREIEVEIGGTGACPELKCSNDKFMWINNTNTKWHAEEFCARDERLTLFIDSHKETDEMFEELFGWED